MRSFEERRAEIFLRSEERLRRRRRRRHILLCGIPVVIAALCAGLLLPQQAPTPAPAESEASSPASVAENRSPYLSVEVQALGDSNTTRIIDAPERLNAIAELLPTLCAKEGLLDASGELISEPETIIPETAFTNQTLGSIGSVEHYTIRLTAADGSQTVFFLSCWFLQRTTTPEQLWMLTTDEWLALSAALGLNE